ARAPWLRRPLALASAGGALAWLGAITLLGVHDAPPLPSLTVQELAGAKPVDLAQVARGQPVVVNLWASWCGPCRQEMPLLAETQRREKAVRFLFVNQGESAEVVRAYLGEQKLALDDVLLNSGSRLAPAVGSRGLPTTLFYDAGGRRIDAHFGVLNEAALESRLRRLRTAR
ncbi:MAG TPA: TlpA disulfide reductase family protein, partial [Albitalea sp.]